jgi:uncharacterized protein YdaL
MKTRLSVRGLFDDPGAFLEKKLEKLIDKDKDNSDGDDKENPKKKKLKKNTDDMENFRTKMNARYIIPVNHPYRIRWDLFIILLSIYNAIMVPIEVSFAPDFFQSSYIFWTERVIDMLFTIDIIVNFRCAYLHKRTGDEIRDWKLIACNYLKG